jgi:chromosome segregation ATPase
MSKRGKDDEAEDEPVAGDEQRVKKQAMSPLEKTIETTKRRVRQSARVKEQVQRRVRDLEKMYTDLNQINRNLLNERQELENNRTRMIDQFNAMRAEMDRLQQQLENNRDTQEQLQIYRIQVELEIKNQVDTLKGLNVEMDTISDGYMDLLEQDETKRTIYMEYVTQMLNEAKPSLEEQPVIAEALKSLEELDLATIREKVKMLEQSLDDDETTLVQKITALELSKEIKRRKPEATAAEAEEPTAAKAPRGRRKK